MSTSNEPTPSEAPAFYTWAGETWFYNKRKGYHYSRDGSLLHRCLWIDAHGAVPDGFDVHHINRERWDTRLDNLSLLPHSEHMRLTWQERTDQDKLDTRSRSERSTKGLLEMWKRRPHRAVICAQCGVEYFSNGMRTKWCGKECRNEAAKLAARNKRAARRMGNAAN